jgi:hypothetical protein
VRLLLFDAGIRVYHFCNILIIQYMNSWLLPIFSRHDTASHQVFKKRSVPVPAADLNHQPSVHQLYLHNSRSRKKGTVIHG